LFQTIPQLNTPINYTPLEKVTEIIVTDPKHALFGRKFPLASVGTRTLENSYVLVKYQAHVFLRIPLISTNLVDDYKGPFCKIDLPSLQELVSLAQENHCICQRNQEKSGKTYHQKNKMKSANTYQ
jgi:hypothetical protein